MQNRLLIAFLFLAVASSFFWMSQARQLENRFSVLRESFSQKNNAGGIGVSFSESSAYFGRLTVCPNPDLNIQGTLKLRNTGDNVKQLQQFLTAYYALNIAQNVTGFFGGETERWLKQFQQEHDIYQSGITDFDTMEQIYNELRLVCQPRITSIDPQRPQRNETVTITGTNFPVKNQATIEIWQTNNLFFNQRYSFKATSPDGTTLSFQVPAGARAIGIHDDRFRVRVSTNMGNSNKGWIYVYVDEYDRGRTDVPQPPTSTPTPISGSDRCTNDYRVRPSACNADPECNWDYGATKCVSKTTGRTPTTEDSCNSYSYWSGQKCNSNPKCWWNSDAPQGQKCTSRL